MEKFGVFETVRIEDGETTFLPYHYERIKKSAFVLDIPFTISYEMFERKLKGIDSKGLKLVKFALFEDGSYAVSERVCIVPESVSLLADNCIKRKRDFLSEFKTLSIYDSLFALSKAKKKGFDEVLLTDVNGFISESAFANIFFVKRGVFFTPSLETGCLPGTRRKIVIEILKRMGVPIVEGFFKMDFSETADEVFLTSAKYDVISVRRIGNKSLKSEGTSWVDRLKVVMAGFKIKK